MNAGRKSSKDERKARLAAALRVNLRRRKEQERARRPAAVAEKADRGKEKPCG